MGRHSFGSPHNNDLPSPSATLGPEVDNPIGLFDDIKVVLDQNHRVTEIDQSLQNFYELFHIRKMETRGGFVNHINRLPSATLGEFEGQLDPLSFPARKGECRLPQLDIPKTNGLEGSQFMSNWGDTHEKLRRFVDGHLEHLVDVFPFVADFQGLSVKPPAVTDIAGDVDIGKEMHLNLYGTVPLAVLAAPTFDIEAETSGLVATGLRLWQRGVEVSDGAEYPDVGGRIRPWGATNRALVDGNDLVEVHDALQATVGPHG